jgi:hypothetical protein
MFVDAPHIGTKEAHLAFIEQQFTQLTHAFRELRTTHARVQKTGMDRIEYRIQYLQPVAVVIGPVGHQGLTLDFERVIHREFRH